MASRVELQEQIEGLKRLLEDARGERDRYREAIRWALGFMPRTGYSFGQGLSGDPDGRSEFWWRRELRDRAGEV